MKTKRKLHLLEPIEVEAMLVTPAGVPGVPLSPAQAYTASHARSTVWGW